MSTDDLYDYVQFFNDDEWSLIGIVPKNGSGDKFQGSDHQSLDLQTVKNLIPKTKPNKIISPAFNPIQQEFKSNPNSLSGITSSSSIVNENVVYQTAPSNLALVNITEKPKKTNILTGFGN